MLHRGPDGDGTWFDDKIALLHRRLSIIDLSNAAAQPMVSETGRFVLTYNGEIYNFQALRREMESEGVVFHSNSDTEVLLTLYEREGPDCLSKLNGMFAFAIWDTVEESLFLARDRLGKKPLYIFQANGHVAFASEIKALLTLPFVHREVRMDAVKDFFFHQYVPDPKTIFENIEKLEPGHWTKIEGGQRKTHQYWELTFKNQFTKHENVLSDELHELIDDAVRIRMISDVPLGGFLSGGIDSSAITGLMAKNSTKAVTTCSIGFNSKKYDEVEHARRVAGLFSTDHHEYTVQATVEANIRHITSFFDEPFADPSYVPTFFVAQLARQAVTVALAGDGGDENFAGYSKYVTDQTENRLRSRIPSSLRKTLFPGLAKTARCVPHPLFARASNLLNTLAVEPDESFFITNSFFDPILWNRLLKQDVKKITGDYQPSVKTCSDYNNAPADDHLSRILYTDIKTFLPGDILVKVDRMTMANSLESRAPLLDYRVVEFAASIPSNLKLKGSQKKYILKKATQRLLPDDILYRKKMGFSVPLARWLNHELKSTMESVISSESSGLDQFFEMSVIHQLWEEHQKNGFGHTQELWSILVFGLWWQHYMAVTSQATLRKPDSIKERDATNA